jgi:DNA-binding IclR family transcriptional regulator
MAGNTSVPGATVTSRVLALLGAFDARHRELSLSDLARRSGVPLATAHRLVTELAEWGALNRTEDGKYVVGRRLWDIGLLAPVARELREVAIPFLHDLYGATLETVHLAVREDDHVLYLETLSGTRSVPVVSTVGSRLPMHASGSGSSRGRCRASSRARSRRRPCWPVSWTGCAPTGTPRPTRR